MKKLAWLCVLALVAALIPLGLIQAQEEPDGTETRPWLITNVAELRAIIDEPNPATVYYKLAFDLDLGPYITAQGWANGWVPIGCSVNGALNKAFSGHLDGGGKTISGLWIDRGVYSGSNVSIGLFGRLGVGATVSNLTVETTSQGVSGRNETGILAGSATGGTITHVRTKGLVTSAASFRVGGFIGSLQSTAGVGETINFINCVNEAEVQGRGSNAGGFVGRVSTSSYTDGKVAVFQGCRNYGDITGGYSSGGICGCARNVDLIECLSAGKLFLDYSSGGLIGGNEGGNILLERCIVENDLTIQTGGQAQSGGLAGGSISNITFRDCLVAGSAKFSSTIVAGVASNGNNVAIERCFVMSSLKLGHYAVQSGIISTCGSAGSSLVNSYYLDTIAGDTFIRAYANTPETLTPNVGASMYGALPPFAARKTASYTGFDFENTWILHPDVN
ncbi:MAG: hypothetical protein FWD16_07265, partial [Clostridia bacterium]|nr:hypothetical protein [Clostridia bacterium]